MINKKATSNKTKLILLDNELQELSEKVKVLTTKGLIKDLINEYTIRNG